jgi:hypothetical protein
MRLKIDALKPAAAWPTTNKRTTPGEPRRAAPRGVRAGHLTTSEHPDLLAAAIRGIAARHRVGTPATVRR